MIIGATLGLTIVSGLARSGVSHLPAPLEGLTPVAAAAASALVFLGSAALLFATFVFLYRLVPAAPTHLGGVWPGALAAALGFEALQFGFSIYVSHFGHYNEVYGSLGAVVAFMLFVYLASMVFLFGAEVAAGDPRLGAAGCCLPGGGAATSGGAASRGAAAGPGPARPSPQAPAAGVAQSVDAPVGNPEGLGRGARPPPGSSSSTTVTRWPPRPVPAAEAHGRYAAAAGRCGAPGRTG